MRPRRARLGCGPIETVLPVAERASMRPRRARLGCVVVHGCAPTRLSWWFRDVPSVPWHPRRARLGLIEAALLVIKAISTETRHPRRARLGLIEARTTRSIHRSQSKHPRRARLGLIEAPRVWCSPATRRCIRGARASASLKQPDQHRAPRKRLSIRGARASASLKPPHNRYASGFGRRIRGARASASLKLNWLDGQAPCHATHPRRARLGLIEAIKPMPQKVDNATHPRRARLGLIEARRLGSCCQIFRCSIRGARASASLKPQAVQATQPLIDKASEARAPRPH